MAMSNQYFIDLSVTGNFRGLFLGFTEIPTI